MMSTPLTGDYKRKENANKSFLVEKTLRKTQGNIEKKGYILE